MRKWRMIVPLLAVFILSSYAARADGIGDSIAGMQPVLDDLYDEMIPLCEKLISVGRAIGGFAALWYISSRVWRHLANAEPIDFYPLFRPFVLGFCIAFFPMVLDLINGIMKPTVTGTAEMMKDSNTSIAMLLKMREEAIKKTDLYKMYVGQSGEGDKQRWLKYLHGLPNESEDINESWLEGFSTSMEFSMEKMRYRFQNSVREWMSEILNVLYQAAALCINTIRTFQMIVLAILGPLVFGLATFDGFQSTLTAWLSRYINLFLWLPVCNIFSAIIGKLQEQMIKLDLTEIGVTGDTFFNTSDIAYLIFLIIGIIGYCTVPTVAGYIINVGQSGALVSKVTSIAQSAGSAGAGNMMAGAAGMVNAPRHFAEGMNGADGAGKTGAFGKDIGHSAAFMVDKLSGPRADSDKKS